MKLVDRRASFLFVLMAAIIAPPVSFASPSPLSAPPACLLLSAVRAGARIVSAGEHGMIFFSDDDGVSWSRAEVPTDATLTTLFFATPSTGWAAGHRGVILKTTDGGATWRKQIEAPNDDRPLFALWFGDDRRGFAGGAYGLLLATSDGGATWTPRKMSADGDAHLYSLVETAGGRIIAAGESGHVFFSDNGGASWTARPLPQPASIFGLAPLDDGALLAYGFRGQLWKTDRGLRQWRSVAKGAGDHLIAHAQGPEDIFLVGDQGMVVVTNRSGETLTKRRRADRRNLTAVIRKTDGSLLLFGETGVTAGPISGADVP